MTKKSSIYSKNTNTNIQIVQFWAYLNFWITNGKKQNLFTFYSNICLKTIDFLAWNNITLKKFMNLGCVELEQTLYPIKW